MLGSPRVCEDIKKIKGWLSCWWLIPLLTVFCRWLLPLDLKLEM